MVGASADSISKLKDFQAKEQAQQRFVSDPGGDAIKKYGIDIKILGGVKAKRVSFIIGKNGKVLFTYFDWSPLANVDTTLKWLQQHPQR